MMAKGSQHISCLANRSLGFLEHIKQKAQLAQQTNLGNTGCCSVLKSQISDKGREVHNLQ